VPPADVAVSTFGPPPGLTAKLVRQCGLAALPSSVSSVAIAWVETARDRSETKRFGGVWVTAYRARTSTASWSALTDDAMQHSRSVDG
jgi:hypothetical protein